jgi:hypothetical protein
MEDQKPERPRGRPKLAETAKAQIHVRVTPDEKAKYQEAAERERVGLSTWLKALADREVG